MSRLVGSLQQSNIDTADHVRKLERNLTVSQAGLTQAKEDASRFEKELAQARPNDS